MQCKPTQPICSIDLPTKNGIDRTMSVRSAGSAKGVKDEVAGQKSLTRTFSAEEEVRD